MKTELPFETKRTGETGRQRLPFMVQLFAVGRPNGLATSMRIPVTPANRTLLRKLRAAELVAWKRAVPRGNE